MTPISKRKIKGENRYRALLVVSGMSQEEAAALHGVSKNAVYGWVYNQSAVPAQRMKELAREVHSIMEHKEGLKKEIMRRILLGEQVRIPRMIKDRETARAKGWPFPSLHWQAVRLAIAELPLEVQAKIIDPSAFGYKRQNV